jgi:tRNA (guanine37-N1)-methyltransferase
MKNNIKINKLKNVKPVLGDVEKAAAKYKGFADRIIMPLPKSSIEFLDSAVATARSSATLHIYMMVDNSAPKEEAGRMLKAHAALRKYKAEILGWRIVRNYSPKQVEIVVDWRISK